MSNEAEDIDTYVVRKSKQVYKYMASSEKSVSMPTAKVTSIIGSKYSVRIIGDKNDITGLNSYSNIPIIVGDEVLLMVVGGNLTNTFIFSKKII